MPGYSKILFEDLLFPPLFSALLSVVPLPHENEVQCTALLPLLADWSSDNPVKVSERRSQNRKCLFPPSLFHHCQMNFQSSIHPLMDFLPEKQFLLQVPDQFLLSKPHPLLKLPEGFQVRSLNLLRLVPELILPPSVVRLCQMKPQSSEAMLPLPLFQER
ncbi:hypothetical protein D3C80_1574910 [compost metagenome]